MAEGVYQEFFDSVTAGLVIEQSHQGQLFRLLRMFVDLPVGVTSLAKSGANPFTPREVMEALRQAAMALQSRSALALVSQE